MALTSTRLLPVLAVMAAGLMQVPAALGYTTRQVGGFKPSSLLSGIGVGGDGSVWASDIEYPPEGGSAPALAVVNPADEALRRVPVTAVSPDNGLIFGVAAGPNGSTWSTRFYRNAVSRIDSDGSEHFYELPTVDSSPFGIVKGADGAMWFIERRGPDGNLWIANYGTNQVLTVNLRGQTIASYPVSSPADITVGSDGNIWTTDPNHDAISRIVPGGATQTFGLPAEATLHQPNSIVSGSDGAVWFAEYHDGAGAVGRMTTDGVLTDQVPTGGSDPVDLTSAAGSVWISEQNPGGIGRIDVTTATTAAVVGSPSGGGGEASTPADASPLSALSPTPSNVTGTPNATYVALGDSYSSGEGVTPFSPTAPQCHRSTRAYSELLPVAQLQRLSGTTDTTRLLVACTGATTADIEHGNASKHVPAQLDAITSRTRLVTISIGGNDALFAKVLEACVRDGTNPSAPDCQKAYRKRVSDAVRTLTGKGSQDSVVRLSRVYKDIRMRAPLARILVLNYPQVFAQPRHTQRGGLTGCVVGKANFVGKTRITASVAGDDIAWIRLQQTAFNEAIKEQVRAAGVNAQYVDVARALSGHALCNGGKTAWIRGLHDQGGPDQQYSFHPTQDGQSAMARVIAAIAG